MIKWLILSSILNPAPVRAETIPPITNGFAGIKIKVPSDWLTLERNPGELTLVLPNKRWVVITALSKDSSSGRELANSRIKSLTNFRLKLPETVKEWSVGKTRYATTCFSSRSTRKIRPTSILEFDVWNDRIHVNGRLNLASIADVLVAQDLELIARSVRLPN